MMTQSIKKTDENSNSIIAYCWVCGKPIHRSDTGYYKMLFHDDYCCFEHSMIGRDCDEDKER